MWEGVIGRKQWLASGLQLFLGKAAIRSSCLVYFSVVLCILLDASPLLSILRKVEKEGTSNEVVPVEVLKTGGKLKYKVQQGQFAASMGTPWKQGAGRALPPGCCSQCFPRMVAMKI